MMKAAFLEDLEMIAVRETPIPIPTANEALMKVRACAVCGSDLKIFHFGNRRVQYPTIVGHEVAGEIVQTGSDVEAVRVGDRVAIGADIPGVWNTNIPGKTEYIDYATGHEFAGGFAEYMLLNADMLRFGPVSRIPESLSWEEAALAEPLACALHGLELAKFGPGKSIAVIGLGPIGVMILQIARAFGASRVFGIQRSRTRLALARDIEPEAICLAGEDGDVVEQILAQTEGQGVDCVITAAGTVQSHVDAIKMVGHRGYVNLFGGLRGEPPLTIDSNIIHYKECYVMGSHGSYPRHHKHAVQLLASQRVTGERYISARFTLDEIREAYAYHESRAGLKVVVKPHGT